MGTAVINASKPGNADGVNILLVDDHPENLLALESVLNDLGQNLVKVQSGREALKKVLNEDFAVILMDVQMPGMKLRDGDSYPRARAFPAYPHPLPDGI
jgi:CheY-like chemotaxis protein